MSMGLFGCLLTECKILTHPYSEISPGFVKYSDPKIDGFQRHIFTRRCYFCGAQMFNLCATRPWDFHVVFTHNFSPIFGFGDRWLQEAYFLLDGISVNVQLVIYVQCRFPCCGHSHFFLCKSCTSGAEVCGPENY